ncbi:MAG TPA: DUF5916 domain-containing protein [Vicinamibacteria bacterium]|nr:DUF5916 domain-containing protein [Vicinamibacteria bacterium]
MRLPGSTLAFALVLAVATLPAGASTLPAGAPPPPPPVPAQRATSPIEIDGHLEEPAWAAATPVAGFLQKNPDEGAPATEATELRLLFDDHALYVAARLSDSEPGRIARQLSRRDDLAEADTFTLYLDPHRDRRTGVVLQVSAAGVQRDAALYDDNFEDDTWDAVWESAVSVDAGGWTVEMRIPLSQLRFPGTAGHAWGINARRVVYRKNEESWLVLVPKNENGLASRMADLMGIEGVNPGRHLELLPYASVREEHIAPPPGDPFNDGSRAFAGAGVDFKYGVGTGMALVGAINPDFGQVEVDPAVVNLTAFETFYDEKRPFFTEGSAIFLRFGRSGASDYTTFFYPEPQLFYSRRIGRAPQGTASGDFVDAPTSTTILGAAKLVGRTSNGWTVGALEALTGSETAQVAVGDARSRFEVEPLTNYFVARAQHSVGSRGSIGFIVTSVLRDQGSPYLAALLPHTAFVGGMDGHLFLDAKHDWVLSGGFSGSSVSGTSASILRLQLAPQRYYQRPDSPYVQVDPNATSLSGWSGRLGLNRNAGNFTFNAGVWGISPGFEPNDLGYATQTDRGGGHGLVGWRKLVPDGFTRQRRAWIAKWWTWNYGGQCQGNGVQAYLGAQLRNYWQLDATLGKSWNTWDDKLTRGGPTTVRPGIDSLVADVTSDTRRRLWVIGTASLSKREFGSSSQQYTATLNLRPFAALTVSAIPYLLKVHTVAQYLATVPDATATSTFGARYVFGTLDQTEVSVPLRLNLALSPKLSLQLYTQALLSTGRYPLIRELATPRTYDFPVYGVDTGTIGLDPTGGHYVIDPDGSGPASPFNLPVPDFNLKSLRVNAVLRWEFRPGSAAYAVFTQRRVNGENPGDFALGRDFSDLVSSPADNVFMLKVAWWLGR